jgi:murein DD-endopeptidase MepM/ murein hydrolase activator NlpD
LFYGGFKQPIIYGIIAIDIPRGGARSKGAAGHETINTNQDYMKKAVRQGLHRICGLAKNLKTSINRLLGDKNLPGRGFSKIVVFGKGALKLLEKTGFGPLFQAYFTLDRRRTLTSNRRFAFCGMFRILLVYFLVYYTCFPGGVPVPGRAKAETLPGLNAENGMGGGTTPEQILPVYVEASIGEDSEVLGVPEPEEYSKPHLLTFTSYEVKQGDIIGSIAVETGLDQSTIISVNKIKNTRTLQIGQTLMIPNQDGIYYTVQKNDTLLSVAERYKIDPDDIRTANELFSDTLYISASLFLPGARLGSVELQEINGDLFIWPAAGYITSPYGYRANPFGGARQFHSGLDIGAPMGTPIKAAMAGRVSTVGYDKTLGNYVVISHHSGYRTLYGHMSHVQVKTGAYVSAGQRIGGVGTTGLSTGPHLHFTVYKNGVTVNPRSLMK